MLLWVAILGLLVFYLLQGDMVDYEKTYMAFFSGAFSRLVLVEISRWFINRERPCIALKLVPAVKSSFDDSRCFPSGDAAFFGGLIISFIWRNPNGWPATFLYIPLLLMLVTTVVVGLHWFTDMIAGLLISSLGAIVRGYVFLLRLSRGINWIDVVMDFILSLLISMIIFQIYNAECERKERHR
jgi:membrane-associated phospholipid phosphatase